MFKNSRERDLNPLPVGHLVTVPLNICIMRAAKNFPNDLARHGQVQETQKLHYLNWIFSCRNFSFAKKWKI